jgi:hypothetical protein
LILFIISSGVQNGLNTSPTVGGNSTENVLFPRCSISPCYTLGFAPNTSLTRGIMQTLCELNTPKLDFATDLIAFSSRDELYNYTMHLNIHIPIAGGKSEVNPALSLFASSNNAGRTLL